jgi:NADH:ubiquinone oxidoreductase subunit F (NADH-binding)
MGAGKGLEVTTRPLREPRLLDPAPVESVADYERLGGGAGLAAAAKLGPAATIEEVEAAGLRGRGGAGFPTGRKWRAVAEHAALDHPATVVVNAAEGEPGSFKDRELVRRNPYRIIEGAVIAARAVGADRVLVAMKGSFTVELARVRSAIAEVSAVGWTQPTMVDVLVGPEEYLFGEETGLLEVVEGRPPFPRIAPPFRHGADETGDGDASAAGVVMATETGSTAAAPTLANNAETFANVPGILANGPEWYRSVGTPASPGTVVCTVSGSVVRAGIGEVPMGTPLSDVIEMVGGGLPADRALAAVLSGVANPFIPPALVGTPVSYEAMEGIGSGLGAAGFMVFDDTVDLVAVTQGVARFLAVESCGQCTPCKVDGLAIAGLLARLCRGDADDALIAELTNRVGTVADGARCFLAHQQERVVGSLLTLFPEAVQAHMPSATASDVVEAAVPVVIAPLVSLDGGQATIEERHASKQPDWTYEAVDSGKVPAERLAEQGG